MQLTISQRQKQTQQLRISPEQLQINKLHQKFSHRQIEAMLLLHSPRFYFTVNLLVKLTDCT